MHIFYNIININYVLTSTLLPYAYNQFNPQPKKANKKSNEKTAPWEKVIKMMLYLCFSYASVNLNKDLIFMI